MTLYKIVRPGEQVPTGYRVAWHDQARFRAIAYPIGLHLIAWAVRRLWRATYRPLPQDLRWELEERISDLERQRNALIQQLDAAHQTVEMQDGMLERVERQCSGYHRSFMEQCKKVREYERQLASPAPDECDRLVAEATQSETAWRFA